MHLICRDGVQGQSPCNNVPPVDACHTLDLPRREQRALHALRPLHWQFICNDKGSARWALPFFRPSFFTVIRVVHSQFKHGNQKRVALRLIRILGDIVGFGKAITISAPIDKVLPRRVLTLRFCRLDFRRNLTANVFLTLRHENFSFLVRDDRAGLRSRPF